MIQIRGAKETFLTVYNKWISIEAGAIHPNLTVITLGENLTGDQIVTSDQKFTVYTDNRSELW